jgi:hypothetical protein
MVIVRLTKTQLEVVERAFADHDMGWVGERWLNRAVPLRDHTTMVECVMPAIGWQRSLTLLMELTVGPLGGNREDVTKAALNARNRIAQAVATYGAHPALFGVGLYGEHSEVIPVWVTGGIKPARLYDVTPVKNAAFIHLYPERDGPFTVWRAQRVLSVGECGSVLDEAEHLRFLAVSDPAAG